MSQIIMKVTLLFIVLLQFSERGVLTIFDRSNFKSNTYYQHLQSLIVSLVPTDVTAQLINNSAAQIEWKEPSLNRIYNSINGYNIYIRNMDDEKIKKITINNNMRGTSNYRDNDGPIMVYYKTSIVCNYTINNLKPYMSYKVWVNAIFNRRIESKNSTEIDISTDVTVPIAPLILNVSCLSNNAIYIQWQTPTVFNHTVDYYYVYYRTENEEFKEVVVIAKPMIDNKLLHEDLIIRCLVKGKEYEVKVQGATHSMKKSGLIFRGEFSESKKIKLQPYSTILEPNNKTNKNLIDSCLPRFVSKGEVKEVTEGDNIDLQCQVENLGDYLIIWNFYNKETEILFVGTMRLTTNQRFSLINESVLTINGIQSNLIGNYSCVITTYPPQEIVYTIKLLGENKMRNNSEHKMPLPSNKIEDTVASKDTNKNYEYLIKTMETNLETKINNIEAIIHEKLDELLKLSDTINRRIKQIGLRTIGTGEVFNDFNNFSLWYD